MAIHLPYPCAPENELTEIPPAYCRNHRHFRCHRDTLPAFILMCETAQKAAIHLVVISGFRDIILQTAKRPNVVTASTSRVSGSPRQDIRSITPDTHSIWPTKTTLKLTTNLGSKTPPLRHGSWPMPPRTGLNYPSHKATAKASDMSRGTGDFVAPQRLESGFTIKGQSDTLLRLYWSCHFLKGVSICLLTA